MHPLKKELIGFKRDLLAEIAAATILEIIIQNCEDKNITKDIHNTYVISEETIEQTRQEFLAIRHSNYNSPFEALKAHTKHIESILTSGLEEGEKDERSSD